MSLEKVRELDEQIESLEKQRSKLLQEWAEKTCPHKVGDITEVRGYSHVGKKCRIDQVHFTNGWNEKYEWRVIATVLSKDGKPTLLTAKWDQRQD